MRISQFTLIGLAILIPACASTPDPEPEVIVVAPEPVRTCIPLAELRRVVIPAETKKVIAITEIENPPYEPIQRREEQTRIVSPEQVYYVDDAGRAVTDICSQAAE